MRVRHEQFVFKENSLKQKNFFSGWYVTDKKSGRVLFKAAVDGELKVCPTDTDPVNRYERDYLDQYWIAANETEIFCWPELGKSQQRIDQEDKIKDIAKLAIAALVLMIVFMFMLIVLKCLKCLCPFYMEEFHDELIKRS